MTTKFNTALRTSAADAVAGLYDGGIVTIYTGTQPANPNDATVETALVAITLPTPAFAAATSGAAAKAGSWVGVAVNAGTAGWYRMETSDGLKWNDGSVTATGGGGDLEISNTSVVADAVIVVNSFTLTQPAE